MRLPNPERAVVEIAKLTDYCLNPKHEDRKHKARVFAAALGLGSNDAEWLRSRLLRVAHEEAVLTGEPIWQTLLHRFQFGNAAKVPQWSGVGRANRRKFSEAYDLFRDQRRNNDKINGIPLLAPVALVLDLPEQRLTRGQMGTVVEHLRGGNEDALLVEFSDEDGQAYAMAEVRPEHLVVLHRRDTEAA